MINLLSSLALILWFTASLSACTTTTKTLTTDISVAPAAPVATVSQIDEAKRAFSQKNYTLAASLLEPMATEGDGNAQYALGYLYFNGMGVPRDKAKAIRWFRESASKGNKNAIEAIRMISPADLRNSALDEEESTHIKNNEVGPPTDARPEDYNNSEVQDQKESQPAEKAPLPLVEQQSMETVEPLLSLSGGQSDKSNATDQHNSVTKSKSDEGSAEKPSQTSGRDNELTESEKWLISQPDDNYTIQLVVSGREKAMRQYIADNNLQDSAIYYRSPNKGKDLYILVTGSYESFSLASRAISRLSTKVKKSKPWIRSIGEIKKTLRSR